MYLIVKAESVTDAEETAVSRFEEDFVEAGRYTFDYCKLMNPGSSVSGAGRWSEFEGQPNAAPLTSDTAQEWLVDALDYTERHYAENLFGMFRGMVVCLDDSVETAPNAIDQIYAFVKENHEDLSWSSGGEQLREEWSETISALFQENSGTMHRSYAGALRTDNPFEGHIVDYYTYGHMTVADGGHDLENVAELRDEKPEDAWVVPLDVHF